MTYNKAFDICRSHGFWLSRCAGTRRGYWRLRKDGKRTWCKPVFSTLQTAIKYAKGEVYDNTL